MKTLSIVLLFVGSVIFNTLQAQIQSTSNTPSERYSFHKTETDPSVYGIFVGRTSCKELMQDLGLEVNPACIKRKISITLYQDAKTKKPTTYEMQGIDKWSGKGNWQLLQSNNTNRKTEIIQIKLDETHSIYLEKGDENVLFFLDRNLNYMTGDGRFSYTLNRARY